jgi:hypothetical protein
MAQGSGFKVQGEWHRIQGAGIGGRHSKSVDMKCRVSDSTQSQKPNA